MSKKRPYKTYSAEFKQEAVALVTEQGYSVAEAARSLGIRTNLLYRWKQQQLETTAGGGASEPGFDAGQSRYVVCPVRSCQRY